MSGGRLSSRHFARLVESAETLLETDSFDVLRQRTVEVTSSFLPATMVSWNEVDLQGRRIAAVLSESAALPTDPDKVAEYDELFMTYVSDHPVISHYQQTRDGRPYAISDFLSRDAFHRTMLYQHFYRPLNTEDQISFVLPDPRLVIGLAISRDRRGFGPDERTICTLLRTYTVQAYRNIDARLRVRNLLTTVHQLADEHGEIALILDRSGAPEQISGNTRRLLRQYFGDFDPCNLPGEVTTWLRDGNRPLLAPLVRAGEGHSLIVRHIDDGARDILLLFERANTETITNARRLGLTPRETEILSHLCDGLTTKRIAEALTISPRTVDKHVAAILAKLSARSRLEAVSLVVNPSRH